MLFPHWTRFVGGLRPSEARRENKAMAFMEQRCGTSTNGTSPFGSNADSIAGVRGTNPGMRGGPQYQGRGVRRDSPIYLEKPDLQTPSGGATLDRL